MGAPETMNGTAAIVPETPKEIALALAAEKIVAAVARPDGKDVFNLLELLELYEFGIGRLKRSAWVRWRETLALAASVGGVWAVMGKEGPHTVGVFWLTKNPHIELARQIPEPSADGNYAYIAWFWSTSGTWLASDFLAHVQRKAKGAEFFAWHDQRAKVRKRRRGRLWVKQIKRPEGAILGLFTRA